MKVKNIISLIAVALTLTACNDYLDVKPDNEQVATDYWKSKEDVQSVITSGYYYMQQAVPTLLKWGELRGGAMYATSSSDQLLQDFNVTPSSSICKWDGMYKIINMANSVIKYAPGVKARDNTYYDQVLNSDLAEAYFQRAYSYLVLLKNYREVPLITEPYADDSQPFNIAKSSDTAIVRQIKADVEAALATGAAKGTYETSWQTKGRVTKWALYALMTDVCLWSEDYQEAVDYADKILKATDAFRPVFIANTADWFTIFYPGNSNESIFELNWDYNTNQKTNSFTSLFAQSQSSPLMFTNDAVAKMKAETQALKDRGYDDNARMGRMLLATYVPETGQTASWNTANYFYMWKYRGTDVQDITGGARTHNDANFIIYRVAEVMLMKAQAEVMLGNYREAVRLLNRIRNRAGLGNYQDIDLASPDADAQLSQLDELSLLEEIISQKEMEFFGEGKRWYDLLWLGRVRDHKYRSQFIAYVLEGNQTTNLSWIESVLRDENAWYMPVPQYDIEHNKLLVQNPYYSTTK